MKLYYMALKCLPDAYVDDQTRVVWTLAQVVAVHPDRKPIVYRNGEHVWRGIIDGDVIQAKLTPENIVDSYNNSLRGK